jgi:hypothetical protein
LHTRPRSSAAYTPPDVRRSRRGQSVVEFALLAPIMVVLLLLVIDVARVYTTMMSIESAAREAADYGTTLGASKWMPGPAEDGTRAEMQKRACVASTNLPDYDDPDGDPSNGCANPAFSACETQPDALPATCGVNDAALAPCYEATREPPCTVTVTLTYQFHLFLPLNIDVLGTRIGFPSTVAIVRDSTFAMTDIDLSAIPTP